MRPPAVLLAGLVTGLLATLVAAGCTLGAERASEPVATDPASPVPIPSPPPGGGTLRWAIDDPEHLVPGDATTESELLVVSALFEPLTRVDASGRARAALAQSWSVSDDGAEWTFTLSPDARFQAGDGENRPVTADDVAFAWHRAAADGRAGFLLGEVEGYDAVAGGQAQRLSGLQVEDERTLVVTLRRPHTAFDIVVSHPSLAPLPRDRWERDPDAERERPVGNGPFRLAEAPVAGRYLRLQPVDGWHRSEPEVDELLFHVMRPDTAFVAFQQGRLHVGPVPDDAVSRAVADYGEAGAGGVGGGVVRDPRPDLLALGFNVAVPPFDQPDVRRAVSLAIDRVALAEATPGRRDVAGTSLLLPGLPSGGTDRCRDCRHSPAIARNLFERHDVQEITLWMDADRDHSELEQHLREDLAEAGVRLRVERRPFDQWIRAVREGHAGLFRIAWVPEHPTGLDVLGPLLASDGYWNHTGVADDELDALLEAARTASSRTERAEALQQAERRALELRAVTPLLGRQHALVVAEDVVGLQVDTLGRADLSRLRLDRDEPE